VIGAITLDVAGVITSTTVLATAAGWFGSNRRGHKAAKAAEKAAVTAAEALGSPNGNGPANQALHILIEMQKHQDLKTDRLLEQMAAMGVQLDEWTSILSDHVSDPYAHRGSS
jgi:hypothetical protein